MSKGTVETFSFIAVVVIVTAAFIWLLMPYYSAILWAVILAILFNPLQVKLERWLGGRRNIAAGISMLACICIVVIPVSAILASIGQEATSIYMRMSTRELNLSQIIANIHNALPPFVHHGIEALNLGNLAEIQNRLTTMALQASQMAATRAVAIGQNTAQFIVGLGIMLYLLFFLFRDNRQLISVIRTASPLNQQYTDHILNKFASVVEATVKGNIIIAAIQGTIGGVAFWFLDIQAAMLWGVVMAVLSLLPAVGASLVWVPASAILFFSGDYIRGGILFLIGLFVISVIDNLLRPTLVGKGTRLPDYLIFISTVGGIWLFGMNGLVIGPLIAALFVSVWSLFGNSPWHSTKE
ncbi:AI-2E family transporter [Pseudochelatococcus contaminans]|uniref:Putative PurR-regulated permease PerM n=1 Tax=Pseudochelatococcus contaminans TaxID=1538103 RepID=A0A7W5Z4B1_9HYPH|nr:AI-2E family transporter [Pseudochelatococcus contaminans]MBB3809729.1 putative PurR-regulated permease PerM [Pseudochelatococcus contaminans]